MTRAVDPGVAAPRIRWFTRLGLAIVRPRWALAVAADRRHAGRSGSDFIVALVILIAATQLRGLFAAGWLARSLDVELGLHAAMHVLTRTVTIDLAFLVLGAIILWAIAGKQRNLGRAFDLACVAALPLLYVELVATVFVRTLDLAVPSVIGWTLAALSFAWTGIVLALGTRPARHLPSAAAAPPPPVLRAGRLAGLALIAVAVLGAAVQVRWIVGTMEDLRPMHTGDPVPVFALPTVGAHGVLGAPYPISEAAGSVVVVDFWATWCGPCLAAMPGLDALARTHPDVVVLAINLDDPVAARALFDQRGWKLRLLEDDGAVSERFGVMTIPHTVVLDRAGVVRSVVRGGERELLAEVEAIAAEPIRK